MDNVNHQSSSFMKSFALENVRLKLDTIVMVTLTTCACVKRKLLVTGKKNELTQHVLLH